MWLEFYERRRLKRLFYSKPVVGVLGLIAILSCIPVYGMYQKYSLTRIHKDAAAAELDRLLARERALLEETQRLNTPFGREDEIRQKFDVARPGEHMIILIEGETNQLEETNTELSPKHSSSFSPSR